MTNPSEPDGIENPAPSETTDQAAAPTTMHGRGAWVASSRIWAITVIASAVAVAALVTTVVISLRSHHSQAGGVDPNLYRETATPITDRTYFDPRDLPILDPFYTKQNVLVLDTIQKYFAAMGQQKTATVEALTCPAMRMSRDAEGIDVFDQWVREQYASHGTPHLEYTNFMNYPTRDEATVDTFVFYEHPVGGLNGATNQPVRINMMHEETNWKVCGVERR